MTSPFFQRRCDSDTTGNTVRNLQWRPRGHLHSETNPRNKAQFLNSHVT